MDCGATLAKYILFLFNILFVICGILIIVFGSLMITSVSEIAAQSDVLPINSAAIVIILLGCVIFFIALLGCCGAIRKNKCCTMLYSVVMLILLISQLALVATVWANHENVSENLNKAIDTFWKERNSNEHPSVMHIIEIGFQCCGKDNYLDYKSPEIIPPSCCGTTDKQCPAAEAKERPGCRKTFIQFWQKNMDVIRFAGLAIAGIELVAFILSCCLLNQIRNNKRREMY